MVKKAIIFLLSSFLLVSCGPTTQTPASFSVVTVYATSAAQPWLTDLYACANQQSVLLNVTATDPEIYLQLGEPANLVSPAYQIDEEEIWIVTNRESSIQKLTREEVQALFSAQSDSAVQMWVYASEEDMQMVFDQLVMKERSVSALARVAFSAQEMVNLLSAESNSVGILPSRFVTENIRQVYSIGKAPVLAITKTQATGIISMLLTCLAQ